MTFSHHPLCKCLTGQLLSPHTGLLCIGLLAAVPRLLFTQFSLISRELREKIQPEILELIKQQRLNRLCEGSSFRKIGNRRRQGGACYLLQLPVQGY